jgi:hypothetical protein
MTLMPACRAQNAYKGDPRQSHQSEYDNVFRVSATAPNQRRLAAHNIQSTYCTTSAPDRGVADVLGCKESMTVIARHCTESDKGERQCSAPWSEHPTRQALMACVVISDSQTDRLNCSNEAQVLTALLGSYTAPGFTQ